ncbi:MAG: low specificity L-threonine aldolase [Alphaproteobacteria bacterium]|nr:low specificity L-threonine aldolase [Alphaproteobacteria bacterium]
MNFSSDNAWGAWPEMIEAIAREAAGPAPSYGDDAVTSRLKKRFGEIFGREVEVFPVISGTAANALAIATLVPPHGAVFCHAHSHIAVDECGAPEFFSHGAKLVELDGSHAKLVPAAVEAALAHFHKGFVHHVQPALLSITQATELGTVYRPDEIAALAGLARRQGMKVHMDGARFANALATLRCSAADATWRAGVDALSFGATKGGALGAEAVIFFDPEAAADFAYRRKKSGHLISKMRFVSAQLEAYLEGDLWLQRAAHANSLAKALADGLKKISGVEIAEATEANSVFAWLPDALGARLRARGARFYDWQPSSDGRTLVRFVTSFATPLREVEALLEAARD